MNTTISKNPIIIFLTGPTAVGKTKLAMELSKYLPINIISVDSGLVYKTLDIGTGKPTKNELLKVPHQLIDIKDPLENYSVGEFIQDALKEIKKSINTCRIPFLVGGTMLYFRSLLYGLALLPPSNIILRKNIIKISKVVGINAIHKKLASIDPISANRIHPNDLQRIVRALEVYFVSGKTLTQLINRPQVNSPYTVVQLALLPYNSTSLNKDIELRFQKMLDIGFQHEVERLLNRGDLHINLNSINRIGYGQMWKFLLNQLNYDQMIQQSLTATRQLAKHQMTWLKKWKNIHYISNVSTSNALSYILILLKKYYKLFN